MCLNRGMGCWVFCGRGSCLLTTSTAGCWMCVEIALRVARASRGCNKEVEEVVQVMIQSQLAGMRVQTTESRIDRWSTNFFGAQTMINYSLDLQIVSKQFLLQLQFT